MILAIYLKQDEITMIKQTFYIKEWLEKNLNGHGKAKLKMRISQMDRKETPIFQHQIPSNKRYVHLERESHVAS